MFVVRKAKSRVSLLFLEEGELYVKHCQSTLSQPSLSLTPISGYLHINSRSLIFESCKRDFPAMRFCYRDFSADPDVSGTTSLAFPIDKYIELPSPRHPQPYQSVTLQFAEIVSVSVSTADKKLILELFSSNCTHRSGFDQDQATALSKEAKAGKSSMRWLETPLERPIGSSAVRVRRIRPLLALDTDLFVSNERLYYQTRTPFPRLKSLAFTTILHVFPRRWRLRNLALELSLRSQKRLFFAFDSESTRDDLLSYVSQQVPSLPSSDSILERATSDWASRTISNREYLSLLNDLGGRSVCDLAQYPVFPWVLSDYTSETLDLSAAESYRDLTKPLGALNPARLEGFKKRFAEMQEPKFLYGTHYSNSGYVIGYLVRKYPLYALSLHGGKFDLPDRLFHSIAQEWKSVNSDDTGLKELIPEFFGTDQSFLLNSLRTKLGVRTDKVAVNDVELPRWAKSPSHFLSTQRQALESEIVSSTLHSWIDLIFGYKQRGEHALSADNVFMPHNYEGGVNLDLIADPEQRHANETQAVEYGQCPKQLFRVPHPARAPAMLHRRVAASGGRSEWSGEELTLRVPKVEEDAHRREVSHISASDSLGISVGLDGHLCIFSSSCLSRLSLDTNPLWTSAIRTDSQSAVVAGYSHCLHLIDLPSASPIPHKEWEHPDAISASSYIDSVDLYATGAWDSVIRLWDVRAKSCVTRLQLHSCRITQLAGSGVGLASVDSEGTLVLSDLRMYEEEFRVRDVHKPCFLHMTADCITVGHREMVSVIAKSDRRVTVSPGRRLSVGATDGKLVLSAYGTSVELWEMSSMSCLQRLAKDAISALSITALYSTPSGKTSYFGTDRGQIYIY